MLKNMVSKRGSQEIEIVDGNGCVTIRTVDVKKHSSKSVTVFDELLPVLIARLSSVAITRRPTPRALDGAKAAKK